MDGVRVRAVSLLVRAERGAAVAAQWRRAGVYRAEPLRSPSPSTISCPQPPSIAPPLAFGTRRRVCVNAMQLRAQTITAAADT